MTTKHLDDTVNIKEDAIKEFILLLHEWYRYLLSKWKMIFIFGLLGGGLGIAYSFFYKPIYTATTTFVLEDEKGSGGIGSLAGLATIAGMDLAGGGGIFQGDNILELYKSRSIIEKTLFTNIIINGRQELLIDYYIDFNNLRKDWEHDPKLSNIKFSGSKTFNRTQDSLIGVIIKDINKNILFVTKPDKKLTVFNAQVKSRNEIFSKAFNENIVKNVNDFYILTKTKKSAKNIAILENKTDSVRNIMNGAIYNAAAINDATPNINPTRQLQRIAPVQKSQFNAETNKGILAELVKNLEMSKLSLLKETPLIQIIDSPVYPLEVSRFGKIKGFFLGATSSIFFVLIFLFLKRFLKIDTI